MSLLFLTQNTSSDHPCYWQLHLRQLNCFEPWCQPSLRLCLPFQVSYQHCQPFPISLHLLSPFTSAFGKTASGSGFFVATGNITVVVKMYAVIKTNMEVTNQKSDFFAMSMD